MSASRARAERKRIAALAQLQTQGGEPCSHDGKLSKIANRVLRQPGKADRTIYRCAYCRALVSLGGAR